MYRFLKDYNPVLTVLGLVGKSHFGFELNKVTTGARFSFGSVKRIFIFDVFTLWSADFFAEVVKYFSKFSVPNRNSIHIKHFLPNKTR